MKINKDFALLAALFACAGALIIFSQEAKEGALYGLSLAEKIIAPSLLPLLIIFNTVQLSGAGRALENLLSPFIRGILRLEKCTGAAVFFGLIGGYPTGALLTESLFRENDIDYAVARRLLRFNFSGGAAFIITAVGSEMLGSRKSGIILFAAVTASAITVAFVSGFFYKRPENNCADYMSLDAGDALCKSVEKSTASVIGITAYIVFFCAFEGIAKIPSALVPLIEITSGAAVFGSVNKLPELAFFLSFGGFCIHMQLLPVIKSVKMKYADFLLWRLIGAGLSYVFCLALKHFFPVETAVFSNYSGAVIRATSVNAALTVLMIIGCAVMIFDLDGRKSRC